MIFLRGEYRGVRKVASVPSGRLTPVPILRRGARLENERPREIPLGLLLVAFLSASCSSGPAIPTVEVEEATFERRVTAEGQVEAKDATPISGPTDSEGAMKVAWLVAEGAHVAEGDVVVRFDPIDMEKLLADGRAERAVADSRRTGMEAESDGMLRNLDRDAALAREELSASAKFQAKDPDIFSRREIIQAEIDRDLASRRLEHAEGSRAVRSRIATADLALVDIDRRKADLRIGQAQKGLRALEVAAPHAGIVVYQRDWRGNSTRVGDTIWPGEEIAEIPRLETMIAKVFVLEADAGGLAVGLPAEVVLEAHPEAPVPAKITKVATLAKRRMGWVPVQYFEVELAFDRQEPERMKPGQRVRAALALERREKVVVIPRGSVFERDGKKVVYRRNGSGFDPVEVELGPAAVGNVVVEKGLSAGDHIALRDPEAEQRAPDGKAGAAPPRPGSAS